MIEVPYLDDYLKYMKNIVLASDYTLANYPIHLRNFFEFNNGKYNANAKTFLNYTNYLIEVKKFSRSSINAKLSALRSYYHFLYNQEIYDRDIADKIILLKEEEKEPKKLITQDKVFKILDEITDVRDRALLETLYSTGVREGELSKLNIENVDFTNEFITVLKGKGRKKGKTRIIPISKTSLKWLKAYLGSRKAGPLFLNNRGGRLGERSVYNIVKQYFPFPPHDLRHCLATHLLKKTGNLKVVSDILGHASTSVTESIYINLEPQDLKDVYKNGMDR